MKKIIILGCGISGVTLARLYAEKNYQVDIYETRDHIGGNCYDYYDNHGILVHKYGPHIFHTSNEIVYKFINRFCKLNGYINKVKVKVGNKIVPLPINFKSIKQIFPLEANYIIKKLVNLYRNQKTITLSELQNIKDKKIHLLFKYIYKNVYANYSQKMWSVPIKLLSKDIINRVQITLSYGESYFPNDKYQGLPKEGYTKFIENMLNHKNIKIHLKAREDILKFKGNMTYINNIKCNDKIFYCGSIDRLFKYKFGKLNYRSLYIHFQSFKKSKYQPSAIVNYPSHPLMTRCCEYKQMTLQNSQWTTVSKEYPGKHSLSSWKFKEPFYSINDERNRKLHDIYKGKIKRYKNIHLLGRIAEYKYFDMDDAIQNAMHLVKAN